MRIASLSVRNKQMPFRDEIKSSPGEFHFQTDRKVEKYRILILLKKCDDRIDFYRFTGLQVKSKSEECTVYNSL